MELHLTFKDGTVSGECRDWVGHSLIRGNYSTADGRCHWIKRFPGRHHIFYSGYNEGKGIWGTWEIPPAINSGVTWRGGFHIWPEGMADPSETELSEEADLVHESDLVHIEELPEVVTACSTSRRMPTPVGEVEGSNTPYGLANSVPPPVVLRKSSQSCCFAYPAIFACN
jgi:hypothetical protein